MTRSTLPKTAPAARTVDGSAVDPATVAAYRETLYLVQHAPPFHLQLGQRSEEVARLHKLTRKDCCAFITACNPHSDKHGDADNARRQDQLARELKNRGLEFIAGVGRDPKGQWPDEPSYLVPGLSLQAAKKLGQQFAQNAIVWCGADATPRLVMLR